MGHRSGDQQNWPWRSTRSVEPTRAAKLIDDIGHLRDPDGSYWTGFVFADGKRWPVEKSCWTSGAVVLAVDALSRCSGGNGVFRDVRQTASLPVR